MNNLISIFIFCSLSNFVCYAQNDSNHTIHFIGIMNDKLKTCVSFSGKDPSYLSKVRANLSEIYRSRDFSIILGENDCPKKNKINGYCLFLPRDVKPEDLTTKFHFYKEFALDINMANNECKKIKENYQGYAQVRWVSQNRTWGKL